MNIILLKSEQIQEQTAIIDDPAVILHIQTVLQAQVGDELKIGVLDGQMGVATITKIADQRVCLALPTVWTPPPKKLGVTLILALPRPKVLRRLMMDMTAIGVDQIVLINSCRTEKSYWHSPLLARLDEFVIEGLQQGVDTVRPKIVLAKRFKPFVQDELPAMMAGQAWVAHPYAVQSFAEKTATHGLPSVLIVGAEGGFVPYEIELLQSVGVTAVSLGERILRTEAAINALLGRWLG